MPTAVRAVTAAVVFLALGSAAGAGKGKPEWRQLFDGKTLANWKSTDFGDEGKVYVKDGAIVLEKGKKMTGITYAGKDFPKMDYEVTLEARRVAGRDFFATTTFPVGDRFCSFVVGGWGGRTVGLSNIDFANASENETSRSMEFTTGRWYQIRLRVTRKRIEAWIDREKMVDLDTTDRNIDIRIECRPCRPFGVATWDTVGEVRALRVRPLSAGEKKAE